jgi:hypothetical protein
MTTDACGGRSAPASEASETAWCPTIEPERNFGLSRDANAEFHSRQEATNRFMLAAILLSEDVLKTVRGELRQVTELPVDQKDIERVLREQLIKPDMLEGDQARRPRGRCRVEVSGRSGARSRSRSRRQRYP